MLFMAPRMVYCSIINLLLSLMSKSTTFRSLNYGPCSFRRDHLIVDGRQVVSLMYVHGRALCLMYMAWFTFLLCQLDSWVSDFVFFMDTECPVAWQWSTPVGLSRFVCSLNLWLSGLLVSPMYVWLLSMSHVILYMVPHWCSLGVLSLGCTTIQLAQEKRKGGHIHQTESPTMNRHQGYHLPAIYNQIIPPKSEATHVTLVHEQGP